MLACKTASLVVHLFTNEVQIIRRLNSNAHKRIRNNCFNYINISLFSVCECDLSLGGMWYVVRLLYKEQNYYVQLLRCDAESSVIRLEQVTH